MMARHPRPCQPRGFIFTSNSATGEARSAKCSREPNRQRPHQPATRSGRTRRAIRGSGDRIRGGRRARPIDGEVGSECDRDRNERKCPNQRKRAATDSLLKEWWALRLQFPSAGLDETQITEILKSEGQVWEYSDNRNQES